jgi:hypothetical protein
MTLNLSEPLKGSKSAVHLLLWSYTYGTAIIALNASTVTVI